jgi:hypothetical protein
LLRHHSPGRAKQVEQKKSKALFMPVTPVNAA